MHLVKCIRSSGKDVYNLWYPILICIHVNLNIGCSHIKNVDAFRHVQVRNWKRKRHANQLVAYNAVRRLSPRPY